MYGCRGIAQERLGGALLGEQPRVHDRDPVGQARDDRQVVGDVDGGGASAIDHLAKELEHARLGHHVEAGRRLVEHDHRGRQSTARAMQTRWTCPPDS